MRQSYRTHLMKTEDGTVYGIYSEADFCAEHEHGLGRLHRDMGCGDPVVEGIGRYQPSQEAVSSGRFPVLGKDKFWYRDDKGRKKWVTRSFISSRKNERMPQDAYIPSSAQDATVFFSEYGFLVVSRSEEMDAFLEVLAERARECDIAVFMGGFGSGNPFNRGGLVIAIPSMVSDEDKETLRSSHEDTRLLEEAATRTGIRERVRARVEATSHGGWAFNSPFHLYAISPGWVPEAELEGDEAMVRAGRQAIFGNQREVQFFINNGRGIFGWYSVADLDDWLAGHGKVIEDERKRQKPAA
ncbi:hypothetical protein D3C71_157710 [compost metagenome]